MLPRQAASDLVKRACRRNVRAQRCRELEAIRMPGAEGPDRLLMLNRCDDA